MHLRGTLFHMHNPNYPRFSQPLVITLLAAISVIVLVFAKGFLVPVVLAIIFSMFLLPIAERLEKWGAHRRIATLLSVVLFIIGAIGVISGLSLLVRSFVMDLPELSTQISQNTTALTQLAERIGISIPEISTIRQSFFNILQSSTGFIGNIVSGTTATITQITLTIVYTFFMLSYRNKLKAFMYRMTPNRNHEGYRTIIHKMMSVVPQYLVGLFTSALILAIINSAAFALIGIKQAIFLGTLVALLNIVPYIGPLVGFLGVILFALFTYSPMHALGVGAVFMVVQFLDNNILTPSITASRVKLNGLTAIMGIVLGGMIWGVVGMVLALPVLAMVKIILQNTPGFEAFAYLMGTDDTDEEKTIVKNEVISKILKRTAK